jgi:hypothetical protein
VLSHSGRAFSGAAESICSYGCALRMLGDLTIRILKVGADETSVQGCRRHPEQLCRILGARFTTQ